MADPKATLLVIEDEPALRRVLHSALGAEGYRVVESATARRGSLDAASHKPDLVVLDLGLPDYDGLSVIRSIRGWSKMPIVVLSARAQERSKIEALDAGADDYVTKPFSTGELLARVRVALRHSTRTGAGEPMLVLDAAVVDLDKRQATRDGQPVHLTPIEFRLIVHLARHLGLVVTHRQLLTAVWGPTHAGSTHYLRIYMKQIRDKLEADPARPRHFLTETGIGYRLVVPEAGVPAP